MSVAEVLQGRKADLGGRTITSQEVSELIARLDDRLVPACLLDWMRSYPLAGTEFCLSEEEDESEAGVEMQWLTPSQIVSEMIETYPGIIAGPVGYLAVGSCLVGSGDYYFLKVDTGDDPALVRIPHEAADSNDNLHVDRIEQVSSRLSDFLRKAEVG